MLEAIRQKKENLFYTLILVVILFAMIFVYGSGKQSKTPQGGVAAWVNGEAITEREFQQVLQYKLMQYQQMLGAQYDEKLISAFKIPESTLDELIRAKLLSQQAKRRGFLVSDEELADKIKTLPYFQSEGKFDAERYLKLPNRGSEESRIREEMQTIRWASYLQDRVRLTPEQIKKDVEMMNADLELAYAKIDFKAMAPARPALATEVSDWLKNNMAETQSYYDAHIKDYTEPAAVTLRKIRVGIPFQATAEVKAASQQKAEAILKEVNVSNFETIAKTKSDDELAKKGGLTGWLNRGSLEKPIEEAIDKLKVGEISPLIETSFGYFIVKLEDKREAKVRPIDEVKNKIAETLVQEKAKTSWADNKKKEIEQLLIDGKPIENELKKWKIEVKNTGTFKLADGNIPGLGQLDVLLDGAMELSKANPVAKKLFMAEDRYIYLKLVSFRAPSPKDFTKDSEATEKKVVTALQRGLLQTWQDNLKKTAKIENELLAKSKKGSPKESEQETAQD